MDWLRRNWPDLLIGIALVAVIAGIIATLISGGSFFPVGPGNRTANQGTGSQPAITTPSVTTPGSTSGATTTQPPAAGGATGATTTPTPASGSAVTTTQEPAAGASQPSSSTIAVLPPPGSPSGAQTEPGSAATPSSGSGATTPAATGTTGGAGQVTSTPSTPSTSAPSTPTATAPAASGPVTPAAGSEAPYRVSVGAFGNLENANRQADAFRAAGYPVFLGTQGSLNIVLVGPFDTEEQARTVAARIRDDASLNVSDPTVYVLDPADGDADTASATAPPASATAPAATTTGAAAAPVTTAPTAPPNAATTPATATAGRYLQVGAYGSRESSLPQRERVEDLGFVVSEREESGLIKLLIGPFDGSGLEQAQARLESAGIESFPR